MVSLRLSAVFIFIIITVSSSCRHVMLHLCLTIKIDVTYMLNIKAYIGFMRTAEICVVFPETLKQIQVKACGSVSFDVRN